MVKYIVIGVVISLCLFGPIHLLDKAQTKNVEKLHELEVRIDNLIERTIAETMMNIVSDPTYYFIDVEQSKQWEEIEAVPYSKCYRHLVASSTSDFIICKAI